MFGKKQNKTLEQMADELDRLREEKRGLQDEIETLKSKKKIEEEDIKHMVRMKEERLNVEFQKKEMELERKHQTALDKAHQEYRDKLEKRLEKEVESMKEMYGQILQRLPDVNVRLKGEA